jgi:hypothetical protein
MQLAGDVPLRHLPASRRLADRLTALVGEPPESIRDPRHDQLAGLAGGEVDVGSLGHPQDLVGGGVARLVDVALASPRTRHLRRGVAGGVVGLGVPQDRRHQAHRIDATVDLLALVLLACLLIGVRLGGRGFPQQAVLAGDGEQTERDGGGFPRAIGGGHIGKVRARLVQRHSHGVAGALLEVFDLLIAADHQEARQGELAHRTSLAHRCRDRGAIEVAEDRARSRIHAEILGLLAGILDGEEHRLGGGTTGVIQRSEQCHRGFGERFGAIGEPLRGERPGFVEIGGDQVHRLVERRRQCHLGGGHRSSAA